MERQSRLLARLRAVSREDGQTMAEYAFMLVGVAMIVAGTLVLLGNAVDGLYDSTIAVFP